MSIHGYLTLEVVDLPPAREGRAARNALSPWSSGNSPRHLLASTSLGSAVVADLEGQENITADYVMFRPRKVV